MGDRKFNRKDVLLGDDKMRNTGTPRLYELDIEVRILKLYRYYAVRHIIENVIQQMGFSSTKCDKLVRIIKAQITTLHSFDKEKQIWK